MKDKNILITGSHGFFGRHLVKELNQNGYSQLLLPTEQEADLTEQAQVRELLKKKPHVVIHLAAKVGGIGANQASPGSFAYANVVMGSLLMEEARRAGVEKFICLGTVCSYPKMAYVPFKESELWNGYPEETNAPYGLAKKMLLVQSQAYRKQYGWNAIYLIPVNMYGPGDHFNLKTSHVIPALIKKFSEAKKKGDSKVTLWGDGSASREFLYAGDCAEAIRLAMERYDKGDPVNIGTGREIKIKELAEVIKDLVGFQGKITWDTSKPNGQPRRCLDTSRAKKEFGFTAKTPFVEGLKKTIEWYDEHV
jgi:GDP-L-fucose synthase